MKYSTPVLNRVIRRVSLVVMAIDDFTGKPILGSNVQVSIDGTVKAIKKSEGYHVFVNLNRSRVTVYAVGAQYSPRKLECDLMTGEGQYTFLKLRLTPNRFYPIPQHTTCVEGKAAPESLIRIFSLDSVGAYKLLYDYKKKALGEKREIFIFHPDDLDMEGKLLYITNGKGKNQEFLRIIGVADREKKKYILEQELSISYKKVGTSLFNVYETVADKNGSFFLPITNTYKEKNLYVCEAVGEKIVSLKLELDSGRVNTINLQ